MTVIQVDGDLEKAIRQLKRISYPEFAALRWKQHFPKKSEYRRWKKRKAERKRIRREDYQQSGRQRYLAWRKRKAKQQSV